MIRSVLAAVALCFAGCVVPQMAMNSRERGDSLVDNGHHEAAVSYYTRAITDDPNDYLAYAGRARAYSHDIDLDQWPADKPKANLPAALADYDRAIALNDGDAQAYLNRGVVRAAAGNLDGALKDMNEAIRLNPSDPLNYGYRGLVLLRMNRDDEASAEFARCVKLQPGSKRELDRYVRNIKAKRS